MLTIRQEQFDAFSAAMVKRFEDEMVARLTTQPLSPDGPLTEPAARALVRAGLEKGARLEIETVRDVGILIELMAEFGQDFELQPGRIPVRMALTNKFRSAQTRMELVYLRLKGKKLEPER